MVPLTLFLTHKVSKPDEMECKTWVIFIYIEVKQSCYRPGVAQDGSRKLRFPDFMTTAQDGGKVVSLTHWPPLPPGNTPVTHFC